MKRRWFGMAAVVVTACAISVVSARRIEAQFSSPVKVVNTTSAPAITSRMDDHGRIPYQSIVQVSFCGVDCTFNFGAVPAGHRLVVEQVGGQMVYSTFPGRVDVAVYGPGLIANFDAPIDGYFNQQVLAYFDSPQAPQVVVVSYGGSSSSASSLMLSGYLLDCTAAPCAAIAH